MRNVQAEMAHRIGEFDWEKSSIGAQAHWPEALRLMTRVALNSSFPMLIWWGQDFVQIYNDAYIPLLGARHPAALGQTAQNCWPEVWGAVGPILQHTFATGEPFWGEDMPFELERNGYVEKAYFTFSYSRIGDDLDAGGILCTNVETTISVQREIDFRATADNLANIIYTHAPDGSISWVNSRWSEYTQLPDSIATTAEGWEKIIPPADFRSILEKLNHAFTQGESYEAEIRMKPYGGGDDAYRWHLLRAVPIRNAAGDISRWAGSATDVHDRRVAEDALRENLKRDLEREHQTSLAFQKAALPQGLPSISGLTFNAIYEAAGAGALVGGDWYDAFRLPDGRIVISVGDVIGSGLAAAVTMSAARQAIRGAVQVYPEPAAVLDAADRTLRSEQPDRIVTAFLGILDPFTLTLCYASAGHPPPLLRCPDGSVVDLSTSDLPLGLRNESTSGKHGSIALPNGGLLVLYTDGLTEATHDVLEGERKLREALMSESVYHAFSPAQALRNALLTEAQDDVAILTLRIAQEHADMKRWSFQAHDAIATTLARHEFADALRIAGLAEDEATDAELVLGELLGNVVRHTSGDTEIALDLTTEEPVLHVLDRGPGFTFYARLPRDSMSESGRGLYIATKLARDISVVPRPDGGSHARVVLITRRSAALSISPRYESLPS